MIGFVVSAPPHGYRGWPWWRKICPSPRHAFRVWQRNRDVFFRLWRSELGAALAEPALILLAMGFGLGAYVSLDGNGGYLEFIAPGVIAGYAMYSASFECTYGSYIRMEQERLFEAFIATPASLEDVITGEALWGTTRSLFTGSAILVVVTLLGLASSPWALVVPLTSALAGLTFSSVALVFTAWAPSVESFNYFFTLFVTPMFFFCGVFFPLSGLPEVVQAVAQFLPLTPAVSLARGLMAGDLSWAMLGQAAQLLAFTALFFPLSLVAMRRRLIK